MTLPDPRVLQTLRDDFVLGWFNIEREEYCGSSHGYAKTQTAVATTNGAGGHNVQMFVLSPDLVVMHVLPGFWHPDDFLAELDFARVIERLWSDPDRDRAAKERLYAQLHKAEIRKQSLVTTARSDWQSFDRAAEIAKARNGELRDTVSTRSDAGIELFPLHELVHRRMASQPFVPFHEFNTAAFVDYGRLHYDNNQWVDKRHRRFVALEKLMRQRARSKP